MAKTERFWSKRGGPDGPWDDIVIGSGMGGMTTAALLAKLGRKVLVLEQHYTPGGFTHEFRRAGGYRWDVGVHAIGQVTRHAMTGRVLHALTDGRLEWTSLGPVYERFEFPGGFEIDFPDSPKTFRANLLAAFPNEAEAIDAFFGLVRQVARDMQWFYLARALPQPLSWLAETFLAKDAQRHHDTLTADVLAKLTRDERLRAVLVAQWGYYGSPPSKASFSAQALITRHFSHGGFYPVGGSQAIARELLRTVAQAGGWTRISTGVDQILLDERGRAVGVRTEAGEEIRAARVISAAGVQSTVRRLLPEPARKQPWAQSVSALKPGPAHVCLYLGFKGDVKAAGASAANRWFYETWDMERTVWEVHPERRDWERAPVLYCSFPSLKDPMHDPGEAQQHTGEVVTFVDWSLFEPWADARWGHRGEDYEAFKLRLQDALLAQFLEHMPELGPLLDHVEISTPASTHHFTRPMHGSIYGLEPTPERFANPHLRPHSPVPGLMFSGSEVTIGGVMGAMLGGLLAGVAAEPIRALSYLRQHT